MKNDMSGIYQWIKSCGCSIDRNLIVLCTKHYNEAHITVKNKMVEIK